MIKIICVGKIKENYLKELINDYKNRISKYHKLEIIELKDNDDIRKETVELLKAINPKDYNIALCINGNSYSSLEFSNYIDYLFNYNSTIAFIIGGSNGLEDDIINICDEKLSFSKFTFPHGLFRGILLEQIYRAFKITNNERYHK
ncbi:MAG: 23S rRNA (pseudouridine(1915)-N(3))-methyltransferase RlmH [Firmicutes bacterium]|nr:23S rRNA (pseudouridine(1915)-N(3))-methyltransferase RlmH [Bacillota bacterium]